MKATNLIEFYEGKGYPYNIDNILNEWDDEDWESKHDFIQWLFPTSTPNRFNPDAPILSEMEATILAELFTDKINAIVERYQSHLLERDLLNYRNHNWLRISRVIQSLRELGQYDKAEQFLTFCKDNCDDTDALQESLEFWENANKTMQLIVENPIDKPLADEEIL